LPKYVKISLMDLPFETKPNRKLFSWPVVVLLLVCFFAGGYYVGIGKIKINSKLQITKGNTPVSQNADYNLLWDALNELNTKFVDQPLDQQKLLHGAIGGLVSAAGDPYTTYFDPQAAKQFADQLKGTFDGIGAEVGMKDDQIVIIAPLDDTPAQKAGLLAGDIILAIDSESTSTMTVDQAVSKIRGIAGTDVTLTILHTGKRSAQEIKITRAHINVKSVKVADKNVTTTGNKPVDPDKVVNGKKIAVITLSQFGDDTKGLFDSAVEKVLAGGYSGMILDLRNDPGGYLDTAVSIASNWVDNGKVVVAEVGYNGETKKYNATGLSRLKDIKTVILVNGGSASASEILAGSLQDYKLATLVGEKTFGKGSVQELTNLKDNSQIKITVAKWLTPNGRGINKIGLEPDVKVGMTADDVKANKDPQMDKALELFE
jgi:carboxyl-terminal processing protease